MNETELERLYSRLEKPVYNVVYRWVWDREEARDLVQEAFVRLWRMRRRVVADTAEPLVYRIAFQSAQEQPDATRNPERSLAVAEQQARLRDAVLALPEDLRQVIALCEFSELRYDQIAEALGIPGGTVGSRRNRALKQLRRMLSGETIAERKR
jgi:RNA polymerase sigma-70 factor (ECF subfamily)